MTINLTRALKVEDFVKVIGQKTAINLLLGFDKTVSYFEQGPELLAQLVRDNIIPPHRIQKLLRVLRYHEEKRAYRVPEAVVLAFWNNPHITNEMRWDILKHFRVVFKFELWDGFTAEEYVKRLNRARGNKFYQLISKIEYIVDTLPDVAEPAAKLLVKRWNPDPLDTQWDAAELMHTLRYLIKHIHYTVAFEIILKIHIPSFRMQLFEIVRKRYPKETKTMMENMRMLDEDDNPHDKILAR